MPNPDYSEKARQEKHEGTVLIKAVIDSQGHIGDVRLLRPLGFGLDKLAIDTVRTWEFKPATCKGRPIPISVIVEITFRLSIG